MGILDEAGLTPVGAPAPAPTSAIAPTPAPAAAPAAPPQPKSILEEAGLTPAPLYQPRAASGVAESIQAGFQGSALGLAWRRKLPDLITDPEHSKWWERAAAGFTHVGSELPLMIGGAIAGGAAAAPTGPVGSLLGAGFGMGVVPATIRQSLMVAYQSGEIKTAADWFNAAREVATQALKEGGINAAAMGAGAVVKAGIAAAGGANAATSKAIGLGLATPITRRAAIGSEGADITTQIATMVSMPAALELRMPRMQEFIDAAILVGGMKAAHVTATRMMTTYEKTGKTPAEQVADAQRDPKIADDIKQPEAAIPELPTRLDPLRIQETLFVDVARLDALERKAEGTPEKTVTDEAGKPAVIPGEPKQLLTDAERIERDQLKTRVGELETRLKLATEHQDSAQRVYEDVLRQAREADKARADTGQTPLGDDHAQAVAALVRARIRTRSERLGVLPEDLYRERPLQIKDEAAAEIAATEAAVPPGAPRFEPPGTDMFGVPRVAVEGLATKEVPLDNLVLSKEVPQFKKDANAEGVIVPLGGKFDRTGVGPIQVWERLDGTMEVISGRHRFDLAKRSGETTIPAQVHREADGFTKHDAGKLDAELNIREEQGSVADYAQHFKAGGTTQEAAEQQGLLARAKGRAGFEIARSASEDTLAAHRAGLLSDEAALSISKAAPQDAALQALGIKVINDGKSILYATNMMRAAAVMRGENKGAGEQGDIFGFDDSALRDMAEMAQRASRRQRAIAEQIAAVSGASKRPEVARKLGVDVQNPEGIKLRIVELRQEQYQWDNWPLYPELVKMLRESDAAPIREALSEPKAAAAAESRYSPEIQAQLDAAKAKHDSLVEYYKRREADNPEDAAKGIKGAGMRYAAERRQITGELTDKEQAAKDAREAGNYIGKLVIVDEKTAEITANPFGRVSVKFADGTKKTVDADQVHPYKLFQDAFELRPETPAELKARDEEAAAAAKRQIAQERAGVKGPVFTADQADLFNTQGTLFQSDKKSATGQARGEPRVDGGRDTLGQGRSGAGLTPEGQLNQEHRASYSIAENLITTLRGADKSSVVHELGHSWLEEIKLDAQRPDAPAQLKADWEILRRELAIPESGDIGRPSHEQFARSTERYLADGKSPSIELQGVFERFKTWLLDIYKDLRNLNVEINPEMREVLDRMLATDEEIAAARELNVPRAYVEEAKATVARKIVPGFKAEQISAEPYADALPKGPGEAPDTSHVSYAHINSPLDVKLTMQRMAEIDQENIQKQRGGTDGVKSWAEANAEQAKYLNDILGGGEDTLKLFAPRDPDAPHVDVRLGILKKLAVGAAQDSARLRDIVLSKGHDATVREQLEYMGSIERARMIQAEFLGERASVARALNALKDTTEGSGDIARMLDAIGYGDTSGKLFQPARSVAEEQAFLKAKLDEIMLNYKGKTAFDIAKLHKEIGTLKGTFKLAKTVSEATTWEKIVEGWRAGLLSGPVTHTTNLFGTGAFQVMRAPVDLLASVIGMARGANVGMAESDRASMSESVARLTGMLGGVGDGIKAGYHTFKLDDPTGKTEAYRTAIEGRKGEIIRIPLRLMGAEDALVSTMYTRGEIATLAIRKAFDENLNPGTREFAERVDYLKDHPTAEMEVAAKSASDRMTFNMPLGEKGVALQSFVAKWNLQWMIPFIRTPINIAKELARMSPFAPVVGEWRADIAKGGVARDRALAEIALGSGVMALTMAYAFEGNISGAGSPDPGKNRGKVGVWQPYSILIGDTWYEYARIQPTGTLMGMAADLAAVWDHMTDEEKDKTPKMLAVAFSNAVTNQTFLQGITNFINAISDPTRFGPKFMQQFAASTVPNIIAQPTAMSDPVVREVNSILEAVQARIPGMRQDLLPKRDWLGEPIQAKERVGVVLPVREQPVSDDKVRQEAARLDISMANAPKKTHIGKGTGKLGDVELTPEERDKFEQVGGKMAHKILANIVNSPGYDDTPDLIKRNIFARVLKESHRAAAVAALPMDKRLAYIQSISEKVQTALQPEEAQ